VLREQAVDLADGLSHALDYARAHQLLHVFAGFERQMHLHPCAAVALGSRTLTVMTGISAIHVTACWSNEDWDCAWSQPAISTWRESLSRGTSRMGMAAQTAAKRING
jgi:hypothetical protein